MSPSKRNSPAAFARWSASGTRLSTDVWRPTHLDCQQRACDGLCLTTSLSSGCGCRPPEEIAVSRLCTDRAVAEQLWRTFQTQRLARLAHVGQQRRLDPERLSSCWVLHLTAHVWALVRVHTGITWCGTRGYCMVATLGMAHGQPELGTDVLCNLAINTAPASQAKHGSGRMTQHT